MENIPAFLLFFGAAILVIAILLSDVVGRKPSARPFLKWLTVFLLSAWQVGCWRALDNFGRAFGNSSDPAAYEVVFITLVVIWFVFQISGYLRRVKSKNSDK